MARLWQDQRVISLEKMRNVVLEIVTNVWLICDPFVIHLGPIYNPSITRPVIHRDLYVTMFDPLNHEWPICNATRDSSVTHIRSIYNPFRDSSRPIRNNVWPPWTMYDPSVMQPVTHTWFIFDLSLTYPVTMCDLSLTYVPYVSLICDQPVTYPVTHITHLQSIGWLLLDLSVTLIYREIPVYFKENLWLF